MPFRAQVFQENVEALAGGTTSDELMHACEAYAAATTPLQKARRIQTIMAVLGRELDDETRQAIMVACGRRCIGDSTLGKARQLGKDARDLDDLLDRLNRTHIGGGHLRREGDVIHAAYDRCYCGLVSKTKEPFSATYCQCSCGWYRQLFETILGRPVEVELRSSIIQGDDRCRFAIRVGDAVWR